MPHPQPPATEISFRLQSSVLLVLRGELPFGQSAGATGRERRIPANGQPAIQATRSPKLPATYREIERAITVDKIPAALNIQNAVRITVRDHDSRAFHVFFALIEDSSDVEEQVSNDIFDDGHNSTGPYTARLHSFGIAPHGKTAVSWHPLGQPKVFVPKVATPYRIQVYIGETMEGGGPMWYSNTFQFFKGHAPKRRSTRHGAETH